MNHSQLHLKLQTSRYDDQYDSMFDQTFDVCSFLNGTQVNPFATWFIHHCLPVFVDRKYFHPCPYLEENIIVNPVKIPVMNTVKGNYILTFALFNEKDSNIVTLQIQSTIS